VLMLAEGVLGRSAIAVLVIGRATQLTIVRIRACQATYRWQMKA